jgi:hypothetical protein
MTCRLSLSLKPIRLRLASYSDSFSTSPLATQEMPSHSAFCPVALRCFPVTVSCSLPKRHGALMSCRTVRMAGGLLA